jgi:hypothetical protein
MILQHVLYFFKEICANIDFSSVFDVLSEIPKIHTRSSIDYQSDQRQIWDYGFTSP